MHLNYLAPAQILHLSILNPLRVQNGGAEWGETAVADYLAGGQSICLYPDFPWDSPPGVAAVARWMKYPYFTDMAGNVLHFIIPVFYTSMNCFNVTSIKSQESILWVQFSSVHWGVTDSLQPHGLQHSRPPCPSPTPPEFIHTHVRWVSDTIHPSHPLSSLSPPTFNLSQHQGLFKWVSSLNQLAKYWNSSFSISPSNEHPGLVSFRMDWMDLLAVQGILKSLLQYHS